MTCRSVGRVAGWLASGLIFFALCGCGDGPKTYPVKGKLEFDNGEIKLLSGSTIICQQLQEPFLQSFADIQADGTFKLRTRLNGVVLPGAAKGNYRAWIILSTDNGSKERQIEETGIDRRYLDSTESPLIFAVPSPQEIVVTVTVGQPGDLPEVTPPWAAFPRCGEPADPDSSADDAL